MNAAANAHLPPLSLTVQYAVSAPELSRTRLRRWAHRALKAAVSDPLCPSQAQGLVLTLRLVDSEESQSLNEAYRGRNSPTNVLTFEYGLDPNQVANSDIVICIPLLYSEAQEQKKPFLHHAAHITIHGVLHALGYDHLDDEQAQHMEALETQILKNMKIPNPYTA